MPRSFSTLPRREQTAVLTFLDIIATWQSESTYTLVTAAPLLRAWAALPARIRASWAASPASVAGAHRADDVARVRRMRDQWALPAYDVVGFGPSVVANLHAKIRGETALMLRGSDLVRYELAIAVTPIAAYATANKPAMQAFAGHGGALGGFASIAAVEHEIVVVGPVFKRLTDARVGRRARVGRSAVAPSGAMCKSGAKKR